MMCIAPRRCSCARSPTDYFASRMCIQRSGAAIKVDFFEQVLRRARSLGCAPARRTRSRTAEDRSQDRKSVVEGKRVSVRVGLGGRRIIKKKIQNTTRTHHALTQNHHDFLK